MLNQLTIPESVFCKFCKKCGARPVIKAVAEGLYVVKCPNNDRHYQTRAGLIDIDDWNRNNTTYFIAELDTNPQVPY
jgi:hypothetical protein